MAMPFARNVISELNTVAKLSRCTLITRPVIQRCCSSESSPPQQAFDEQMLEFLVCPLSKQPLRYDAARSELISDSIGVAYPVVNGIPNLVPQDGRMLNSDNPINIDSKKKEDSKS